MDAAGHLRHGAARDLAVVAAVRILKHELKLVRVLAVARHVVCCDDVTDGRRQFIRAGVVRVHPPIFAGDACEHLVSHGLAGGIKPHGGARPGVDPPDFRKARRGAAKDATDDCAGLVCDRKMA